MCPKRPLSVTYRNARVQHAPRRHTLAPAAVQGLIGAHTAVQLAIGVVRGADPIEAEAMEVGERKALGR